jgi:phosphoglycerate dehydrogenase-like enzyme
LTVKKKILITAQFDSASIAKLKETFEVITLTPIEDSQSLAEGPHSKYLKDANIIICELDLVDQATLELATKLELVVTCRAAPVNVDLVACKARGVVVATTPARNADVTAELTVGLILATVRDLFNATAYMSDKKWSDKDVFEPYRDFRGPSLVNKVVGVIGAGAIGRRVAQRMKSFDTEILFFDPYIDPTEVSDIGSLVDLDELFERSDIVTLHAPLIPATKNMIKREHLEKIKPGSYFVNVGRAGLIEEQPLQELLRSGHIKRAGFDVYWQEPLPLDHWLFELKNVLLLPHIAGASDDVIRMHSQLATNAIHTWALK